MIHSIGGGKLPADDNLVNYADKPTSQFEYLLVLQSFLLHQILV